jgi:hypothetical protein
MKCRFAALPLLSGELWHCYALLINRMMFLMDRAGMDA